MKAIRKIINRIGICSKSEETVFNVDFGKGDETLARSELYMRFENITKEEEEYLYKNTHGCTFFNQPIGDWDLSKCNNYVSVFNGCTNFSEDISKWN